MPAFRGVIAVRSVKRLKPSPEVRLVLSMKNKDAKAQVKRFWLNPKALANVNARVLAKRGAA